MSIIKSRRFLFFFEICWTLYSWQSVGTTEIEVCSILNLLDILLDICKMPQKNRPIKSLKTVDKSILKPGAYSRNTTRVVTKMSTGHFLLAVCR